MHIVYEFSDIGFFCAVVKASYSPFSVNEDEAVAVYEVSWTTFFLWWHFFRSQFEPVTSQLIDGFFVSRQEEPFSFNGIKVLAILPEDFWSVILGVNGDADDEHIGIIGEGFLNFHHVLVHDGANSSA